MLTKADLTADAERYAAAARALGEGMPQGLRVEVMDARDPQQVAKLGDDRIDERLKAIKQQNEEAGVKTLKDTIAVPRTIESSTDFESVRKSLTEAEQKAAGFSTYKFTVNVED